jgi:hypothetical protein
MAYKGFYLVYVGKPYSKKPTTTTSYDYLRAITGFCVNSQRISISKALVKTRGGDLLLIGRLPLLSLPEGLRVSSSSRGFLYLRIAYYVIPSTIGSRG